jgi:hypothetical protein
MRRERWGKWNDAPPASPHGAEKFSGGYVVRDANGFAVAYVYGRSTEDEAMAAKQMTMDEARRIASNIAKPPEMLKRGEFAWEQQAGWLMRSRRTCCRRKCARSGWRALRVSDFAQTAAA